MRNRKINLIDDIINNNPDLYLEKKASAKEILKTLKIYGICVLKGYVSGNILKGLNTNFNAVQILIILLKKNIHANITYPGTECFYLTKKKLFNGDLKFIKSFFYKTFSKSYSTIL